MRLKKSLYFVLPFFLLILGASFTLNKVYNAEKESLLLKTMMDGFKNYHFNPLEIDDGFSTQLHELYLERIDGGKRFLVADDIKQLSRYATKLDNEIEDGNYEFFDLSVLLYEAGIQRAKTYYEKALKKDFDYTIEENFEMDGEKREYPATYKEQELRWEKIMKYEILTRYNSKLEKQKEQLEKPKDERDEDFKEKSEADLLADARADAKKVFDKWFTRMEKTKRSDRLDLYLNSIAGLYDPHTNYYAPIEKQNFDISMSGKLEGIGARLQSDGEETKITEIVTGGPAWKEGSLKANDIIIKVAQGKEEPVEVSGMLINEVVSYIRGKKGTEVVLTVKEADGSEKIVKIIRDVVIMDEGYAKSLILNYEKENISNIGYIYLPRFYADFQDKDGRQCAEDVAQEIKKLKSQKVEAIILDLRNNGGGSLRDVVDMSGLFIEEGPIVQVKARDFKAKILEDEDDRVLFDGHLIVMVNQFSASASEILAAAMQDYNRAVIVGSKSTFGKGTVQRFVNLDDMVWGQKEVKPLGSVKMTIQKFYRIDGGATQLKGVVPDIIFPDKYQDIDLGEREYDNALEWTKIDPVKYSQNVRQVKNMDKLRSNSKKRLELNKTFQLINDNATRLKEVRDDSEVSLNLETFRKERNDETAESKKYEGIMEDAIEGFSLENLKADIETIEGDEGKAARNKKWKEDLLKDVYLQETLLIMKDMMK